MSDNYHQPVMGGTAVQHTMLMTGDQMLLGVVWAAIPAQPPVAPIVDPTPKSATNVAFTRDQRWTKCGDPAQPGVLPDHAVSAIPALAARPDCIELRAGALLHDQQHRPGIPVERSCQHWRPSPPAPPFHRLVAADDRRRAQRAPPQRGRTTAAAYDAAKRFDNGSH